MDKITELLKGSKGLTPLGLVAIFASLSEGILGLATTRTDGFVQVSLTIFVIVYALLIPSVFFIILWKKPGVFYPPKEFGSEKSMQTFATLFHTPKVCHVPLAVETAEPPRYLALFLIKAKFILDNMEQHKILTYHSANPWDTQLIVNRRFDPDQTIENQIEDLRAKLGQLIGVSIEDITLSYDSSCDFQSLKYSYSAKKEAIYKYKCIFVTITNIHKYAYLNENIFTTGREFKWMTLYEMKKDEKTYERNFDVIKFLSDCFHDLFLMPLSF